MGVFCPLNFMKKIKFILAIFLLFGILFIHFAKANSLSWEVVMNNGFGEGNQNRVINSLVVFGDYIYAGVYNGTDGAKVFRSSDGENWTQVNEDGFGDSGHTSVILFTDGRTLYAGTGGELGVSGFKLLKTINGTEWTQIGEDGFGSIDNCSINSMAVFNEKLYISVLYINFETFDMGVRIYRIDSDSSWIKVNEEGFGDAENINSYAMNVFNNQLYVGTQHASRGPEIWRTQTGTEWFQVVDNGFGETNGRFFSSIFTFHEKIYASMVSETGVEIWRSDSGNEGTWTQVNEDGFGNVKNAWTGYTPVIVNDTIYFGTGNEVDDLAKIFTSQNGENWTEEDNSSFVDAGDEGIWSGTFFKNKIYFAISNEDIGGRIIRSQELPSLSITTDTNSLPRAKVGQFYDYQIDIENGTFPYHCTWSGDLPEGMTVTADCKLQGIPKHASNHNFTVYVIDSGIPTQSYSRQLILGVSEDSGDENQITILPETGANNFSIINFLCHSALLLIVFIFLLTPEKTLRNFLK